MCNLGFYYIGCIVYSLFITNTIKTVIGATGGEVYDREGKLACQKIVDTWRKKYNTQFNVEELEYQVRPSAIIINTYPP